MNSDGRIIILDEEPRISLTRTLRMLTQTESDKASRDAAEAKRARRALRLAKAQKNGGIR